MDTVYRKIRIKDKKYLVAPLETAKITTQVKSYIDLIINTPDLSQGDIINLSSNASDIGKYYIKFPQAMVKQNVQEFLPPKFKAFNSDKWDQLKSEPDPTTLQNYMNSIHIGIVISGTMKEW